MVRLGLPLASYRDQPHAPCPHGCKHPQSQGARQGAVRLPPGDRTPQGKRGQQVAQGRRGDDHPPLQNTYISIMVNKAQPFPDGNASRHPPLRRFAPSTAGGSELVPRRHVYQPFQGHQPGTHQPCCPWRRISNSDDVSSERRDIKAALKRPAQTAQNEVGAVADKMERPEHADDSVDGRA